MKRALQFAIGVGVTGAFLWLLLSRLDTDQLLDAIGRTTALPLLAGLALLTLDFGVRLLRWWWMLRLQGANLGPGGCVTPFFASIALNNLLPFRLGDAARAFAFRRHLGIGGGRLLGTLVVERLLDLLALLSLFLVGLIGADDNALPQGIARTAAFVAGGALVTLLLLMSLSRRIQARLPQWLGRLPGKYSGWLEHQSGELLAVLVKLHTPKAMLQLVGFTFVAWFLEAGVFAAAASATASGASAFASLFAMTTGTLATLLPSTPGYVGTFDYFATAGWKAYGLRSEFAAANAVVAHLLLWLPLTIVGLALLVLPAGRALRQRVLRSNASVAPTTGHDQ
jgi:uncharacterized protein (TIRG00374 family)